MSACNDPIQSIRSKAQALFGLYKSQYLNLSLCKGQ